jgi:TonB family protein
MRTFHSIPGLFCLLLLGASAAQDRDPASPRVGNAEHGRVLLSILGPKPRDAAGVTPLQQQELNRRIRCAATRQEIQDQLDFEAAGSTGFYQLAELRGIEKEVCASVQPFPGAVQAIEKQIAPPPSPSMANFRPPPELPVSRPIPPPPPAAPALAPRPVVAAAPRPATPAPPPAPAAKPVATGPAYTPTPDYPKEEMDAGHEGVVLVLLVVNPDGSIQSASVAQSSKFPVLDESALKAARTWRIPAAAGRTIKVPLVFSAH